MATRGRWQYGQQYYTGDIVSLNANVWRAIADNRNILPGTDFRIWNLQVDTTPSTISVETAVRGVTTIGAGVATTQTGGVNQDTRVFIPNRRPIVFTGLAKDNEYYDVQNGPNFFYRRTDPDNAATDGIAGMVLRLGYLYSEFGYERFLLQNPAGGTLVNGTNNYPSGADYPFAYYGSNTWTGLDNNNTFLYEDTIIDERYFVKPWTTTGNPPVDNNVNAAYHRNLPGDPNAIPKPRYQSYINFLKPFLQANPNIEFIPYGGIQVPFKANGQLDFGILANARRNGGPPFSQYLNRFPRFNSTNDVHKLFFATQFNGWKSVGAKGYGFDTGGTMYDPMTGENPGDTPRWFWSQGLKPYGEAVPFISLGGQQIQKKEDAVYQAAPYMGLYHGKEESTTDATGPYGFFDQKWRQVEFDPATTEIHILMNWFWMKRFGWTPQKIREIGREMRDRGYIVSLKTNLPEFTSFDPNSEDYQVLQAIIDL